MATSIPDEFKNYTRFQDLLLKYQLSDETTAEDIVKRWLDPVSRNHVDKLPYFLIPCKKEDLSAIFGSNYAEIFRNVPYDFLDAPTVTETSADLFSAIIQKEEYKTTPVESNEGYVRLYLRALMVNQPVTEIDSNLYTFSRQVRAIGYKDKAPEPISLSIMTYNTFYTPWTEIYLKLLRLAVNIRVTRNQPIKLYLPLAKVDGKGTASAIYQVHDVEILSVKAANKVEDIDTVSISLLNNKSIRTSVIIDNLLVQV